MFDTVQRTIQGYDAMYIFHTGQSEGNGKEHAVAQSRFLTSCPDWQHKEPLPRIASCSNAVLTLLQKQLHEHPLQTVHYRLWYCMYSCLSGTDLVPRPYWWA